MPPLLIMAVLVVLAVGVALVLRRLGPDEEPAPTTHEFSAPTQLHRADFAAPHKPWLVAVFTSSTCSTCAGTLEKASVLASDDVEVQEVEVTRDAELHATYRIEAVPIVVIADSDGVVVRSFMGPPSTTHLWAAVAEAREPGAVPPDCAHE
jgi:hypothetical protein